MNNILWTLRLLDRSQKRRVVFFAILSFFSNVLELIGLLVYSQLILLVTNQDDYKFLVLNFFVFELNPYKLNQNYNQMFLILGLLCLFLFSLRSIFNYSLLSRLLAYLSKAATNLGSKFFSNYLQLNLDHKNLHMVSRTSYAFTWGVSSTIVATLSQLLMIISDITLLLFISIPLFASSILITFFLIAYFGFSFFFLQKYLSARTKECTELSHQAYLDSAEMVNIAVQSAREIFILNKESFVENGYEKNFSHFNRTQARMTVLYALPKYFYDVILIAGILILFIIASTTITSQNLIGVVLLFLAAASRAMPLLLRLQNCVISMRAISPNIDSLRNLIINHSGLSQDRTEAFFTESHVVFDNPTENPPKIIISDLRFQYKNADYPVFSNLNLVIEPGEILGFQGVSGSGKSTLLDLMIGALTPISGDIKYIFSEKIHVSAINSRMAGVGYVPQETVLIGGNLIENICFGENADEYNFENLSYALKIAELDKLVETFSDGIYHQIGRNGQLLSGGQKQRIGIARALYKRPTVLLLDESTSSLDDDTEGKVLDNFRRLGNGLTIIMVAHRDSALAKMDRTIDFSNKL